VEEFEENFQGKVWRWFRNPKKRETGSHYQRTVEGTTD
jgi:hypothetical protein